MSSPTGRCQLKGNILTIERELENGKTVTTEYRVEKLCPDNRICDPAIRLYKLPAGPSYDVIVCDGWIQCECEDWYGRRERTGEQCKHVKSLIRMGLIDGRTG